MQLKIRHLRQSDSWILIWLFLCERKFKPLSPKNNPRDSDYDVGQSDKDERINDGPFYWIPQISMRTSLINNPPVLSFILKIYERPGKHTIPSKLLNFNSR